jgi:hypothetical protein
MILNPFAFLIGRTIAKNRGVPDRTATTDGFAAALVKPWILGIVLVSALARNQASASSGPTRLPSGRLTVTAIPARQAGCIVLFWDGGAPGAYYDVNRTNGASPQVFQTSDTVYIDSSLKSGLTYVYTVSYVDPASGNMITSAAVSAVAP